MVDWMWRRWTAARDRLLYESAWTRGTIVLLNSPLSVGCTVAVLGCCVVECRYLILYCLCICVLFCCRHCLMCWLLCFAARFAACVARFLFTSFMWLLLCFLAV